MGPPRMKVLEGRVSMESGLEDRNNTAGTAGRPPARRVSMESGLEDRNNLCGLVQSGPQTLSLNGVRPRRPEQSGPEAYQSTTQGLSQWSPA